MVPLFRRGFVASMACPIRQSVSSANSTFQLLSFGWRQPNSLYYLAGRMPSVDMDFAPNYCSVCDQAHNRKDSLYCSTRCAKKEARDARHSATSTRSAISASASSPFRKATSSSSLYALSNPSCSSVGSDTRDQHNDGDNKRNTMAPTRLSTDRQSLSSRPLPPIKRNSYSSSIPKSVDLVTPIMTPLTPAGKSRPVHMPVTWQAKILAKC